MRKLIRRWISFFVCLSLCMTMTGCQSENDYGLSESNPVNITVWHYYNGAQAIAFEKLVDEFNCTEGAEQGIVVSTKGLSSVSDLGTAINDSAAKKAGADEMPNIFQCYAETAIALDKQGYIANLSEYITKDEINEYVDSYVNEGYLNGGDELKLFPVAKSVEVMLINKTDWEPFASQKNVKLEDLSTWEGIAEVAQKYYQWSKGKSFFGTDSFANYMLVGSKQLGQDIFTMKDGNVQVNLDKKIMRKLWDNYYVPYVKGYYCHLGRYRSDDVKTGEIIAELTSTTGTSYFPTEVTVGNFDPYAIQYVVLPVPNFEGTEKYVVQQGANMAVTKATQKEEYASVVFLKWITQDEKNLELSVLSGYLPVKKSINNTTAVTEYIDNYKEEPVSDILRDSVLTSIDELATNKLYIPVAFYKGNEARQLLETSMIDEAKDAVKHIKDDKSQAKYLTDKKFEQWYNKLEKQMREVCP